MLLSVTEILPPSNKVNDDVADVDASLVCMGPGCLVKVGKDTDLFWAEIIKLEGSKVTALVQQTFDGAKTYGISIGAEIKFDKKLVTAKGCDKCSYC